MEGAKTTAKEQERTALLRTITDEPLLIRRLLQHKKELTEDFVQHFLTHTVKKVYFSGQASGTFIGNMLAPCMEKLLQVETEVCILPPFLNIFNLTSISSIARMKCLCFALHIQEQQSDQSGWHRNVNG